MQNKRIMLSGYYGFDNAGDEAILLSILQTLRRLDENLEFTVLSGNPEKTKKRYGVDAISRTDLKVIWQSLKRTDLFISGGGSLLQDKTGSLSIPYYLGMIQLAQWSNVPVAIFAQGIGPVNKRMFHKWIQVVFKKAQYISVRDPMSKELLEQWKLPSEQIDQVIDPVFLLESPSDEDVYSFLGKENITLKQKPIIFSVRHWPEGQNDLKSIAKVCDRLIEDGEEVLLLPMHYPDDAEAACDIMALMENKVHLLQREYSPVQLINLVAAGKLVVGMRLHALIFAAARNIPSVGISYDPKIDAFMDLLGEKPTVFSGNISEDALYNKIKADLACYDERKGHIASVAPKLRAQAQKPAEQVIRLLRGTAEDS